MISIYLATVLGWYMVIMAVFMVFRREHLKSAVEGVLSEPPLYFVLAIITLILGLLMVTSHNLWIMGWPVVVTIFSWLVLISGVLRLFFAEALCRVGRKCINSQYGLWIAAGINLIIGVFLLYMVCVASV